MGLLNGVKRILPGDVDLKAHERFASNPKAVNSRGVTKQRATMDVEELSKSLNVVTNTPLTPTEDSECLRARVPNPPIPEIPILAADPSPSPSRLLNLPPDLIQLISTQLHWNSILALRSTCRSLHALLPPSQVLLLRTNLALQALANEYLLLKAWRRKHPRSPRGPLWDVFYASFEWQLLERPAKQLMCYGCMEMKPLHHFVERMSSRGTGLGRQKANYRRCKDCMRREMSIAGVWWREHWLPRRECVRREDGVRGLLGGRWRGEAREEIGVCAICKTRQFELFWGCAGCFDKEQERRRADEWAQILRLAHGTRRNPDGDEVDVPDTADGSEMDSRLLRWALEKLDDWRGQRDQRRRKRCARRAEHTDWTSHWTRKARRLVGRIPGLGGVNGSGARDSTGSGRWQGTWCERVEALVEFLNSEDYQMRGRAVGTQSTSSRLSLPASGPSEDLNNDRQKGSQRALGQRYHTTRISPAKEWKARDQIPLSDDRRETRCAMCWIPTCRRRRYMMGLAYDDRLELERCCQACQVEEKAKRERRARLTAKRMSGTTEEGELAEAFDLLFRD
jgi:hypothetical protein